MNEKWLQISMLLSRLPIRPDLEGYPYLIKMIEIAATYYGQPFPSLNHLCKQTGLYFQIEPDKIKYNTRTLIRDFWNQENSLAVFQAVLHSTISYPLPQKEFISVIAQYIAIHQ